MSIPRFEAMSFNTASPIGERQMFPEDGDRGQGSVLDIVRVKMQKIVPRQTTNALIWGNSGDDMSSSDWYRRT